MSESGSPSGRPPFQQPPVHGEPGSRRNPVLSVVLPGFILGLAVMLAVFAAQLWREVDVASGPASGTAVGGNNVSTSGPAGSGVADSGDPAAASRVSPGLVDINTTLGYTNGQAAGTGIVLSPDGEVLTNNHVIEGATDISATDVGTGQSYPATVVGYDRGHDIAVLALQGASGLPTPALGDSSQARVGDPVIAVGNAGGVGGAPAAAPGRITGIGRSVTANDAVDGTSEQLTGLIQVDADVQSGDSGGALVDGQGRVIGVDTAASTGFQVQQAGGEGFAIPINQALAIARQIENGVGSATIHIGPTPILGVQVQDVATASSSRRHRHLGADSGYPTAGALVSGVLVGSPAEEAGLSAGDVITSLDGHPVDSTDTLSDLLGGHHPGDRTELGWLDLEGGQHSATVRLVTGPAA